MQVPESAKIKRPSIIKQKPRKKQRTEHAQDVGSTTETAALSEAKETVVESPMTVAEEPIEHIPMVEAADFGTEFTREDDQGPDLISAVAQPISFFPTLNDDIMNWDFAQDVLNNDLF